MPIDVTIHVKDEPIEISENDENYSEEICETEAVKSERTTYKRKSKQQNQSYNEDYNLVGSKNEIKGSKISKRIFISKKINQNTARQLGNLTFLTFPSCF